MHKILAELSNDRIRNYNDPQQEPDKKSKLSINKSRRVCFFLVSCKVLLLKAAERFWRTLGKGNTNSPVSEMSRNMKLWYQPQNITAALTL